MPQSEDIIIEALLATAQSRLLEASMHIAQMRVSHLQGEHSKFWKGFRDCSDASAIASLTIIDVSKIKSLADTRIIAEPAGGVN